MFLKPLWVTTQAIVTTAGGIAGYLFGGIDGLIIALVAFVTADYLTAPLKRYRVQRDLPQDHHLHPRRPSQCPRRARSRGYRGAADGDDLFLHLQRRHQPAGERHPPRLAGACADS